MPDNQNQQELTALKQELETTQGEVQSLREELNSLKQKGLLAFISRLSVRQRILAFTLVLIFSGLALLAGTVNKPHTFVDGTSILASQVNENFDILYNLVNGNLTTENISGIDASKITSGTLDAARLPSGSSSGTATSDRITLFEGIVFDSSGAETTPRATGIRARGCTTGKNYHNISGNTVGIFISKSADLPLKNMITGSAADLPVYGPTNIKI